jgi:hypothetical protein
VRPVFDDDGNVVTPAEWNAAIAGHHTVIHRCDIYLEGRLIARGLPFSGGSFTSSGGAAIRSRCSGVRIPGAAIDSRLRPDGYEAQLFQGIIVPGSASSATYTDYVTHDDAYVTHDGDFVVAGEDLDVVGADVTERILWASAGVFAIQEVVLDDSDGGVVTTFDGEDLARRIASAKLRDSVSWSSTSGITLEAYLTAMLGDAVSYMTFSAEGTTHPAPDVVHERNSDPWSIFIEEAKGVGYEVFVRDWQVIWRPEPDRRSVEPVAVLAEGGAWVAGQVELSRRDTHNLWTVVGTNPETEGTEIVATAIEDDPTAITYYEGPFGKAPADDERSEDIDTQDKANAAVEARRARNRGRGRTITVTSWPNVALEPGDGMQLYRPILGVDEIAVLDGNNAQLSADGRGTFTFITKQIAEDVVA